MRLILSLITMSLVASAAAADPIDPSVNLLSSGLFGSASRMSGPSCETSTQPAAHVLSVASPAALLQQDSPAPLHAAAVEHSDAYRTRAKIHKYASYATLPLFATEVALGQSLYNSGGDGKKGAHIAVGSAIVGLFAVNTVTGVWNMFGEDRQVKEGRTLRLVHGLLMMAANVGFVATAMSGPETEHEGGAATVEGDKAAHRSLALGSIGVATAGYLIMLFGNH